MKKTGLYHFAQVVVPLFFKLFYRYKIIGAENIPKDGSVVICSNHTAYKDPIFMGLIQKRQVWFMAKKELYKNKFMSFLITKLGAFPVERSGGISAIRRGIDILKQGGIVGIFIEGTRSKTGELLRPKPGAMLLAYETDSAVVPACIIGVDGKPPRIFRRTVVRIGKPVSVKELGMEDASGMAMRKASRAVMEQISLLKDETVREYAKAA